MAYKKLYKKELWPMVNRESRQLLSDYQLELKANGKSEKTIYQYSADIKAFLTWIYENMGNMYVLDLKKRAFRNFFLEMMDNGTSPARVNRFQSSIRNMLEFAAQDDDEYEYDINAMKSIKGLHKEAVREIVFLSDDQVTSILDYLIEKRQYQKALYVSLSYDSAGRRNEIYQVKKAGFLENSQTNTVVGKRGKKFKLLYFNRTKEIAKLWFEQRGDDNVESLWIIDNQEGRKQVAYESLYNWAVSLRKILNKIDGSDLDINSHSFRHSALENYSNGTHFTLLQLGKKELPLNVIKLIAHHESIDTTQGYLANHDDELLEGAFGISLDTDISL